MPGLIQYMNSLKDATDLELICHRAGWKEHDHRHQALKLELERRAKKREQRVAWTAIGISAASLFVSLATAIVTAWHAH
jgi:hypothetical protein